MYDMLIIGGGPAGLSAAITARLRDKAVAVISNNRRESGLYKAREVGNYPGLPGISGAELSCRLTAHAAGLGAVIKTGRVTSAMRTDRAVHVGFGDETLSGAALILAVGIVPGAVFPGEQALLGRGVSYCATCDGMLYRGKRVCVVCHAPDAEREAAFLASIGCEVTTLTTKRITVNGEDRVTSVTADGETIACDGVFILRQTIAPSLLLPELETQGGHIRVDSAMRTSLPGVYAAGDCTGAPYQIAKASGEGQVAALSAIEYIDAPERAARE